jgi:hypothetical protein
MNPTAEDIHGSKRIKRTSRCEGPASVSPPRVLYRRPLRDCSRGVTVRPQRAGISWFVPSNLSYQNVREGTAETLADMIGTTRSRVSFFMNKFRKLGLIDYNGKIDVHQSLLNAVLHDKPEIRADEPA